MDRTSPAREYNKAVTQLIIIAFFSVFGGIVAAFSLHGYNELGFDRTLSIAMFGFGAVPVAVCGIVIYPVLQALRITRGGGWTPDQPQQQAPTNDASDMLNFPQEHTPTDARLEVVADRTIYLSTHQPDNGTWGDLANTLYDHGWAWSREGALRESECFKNLTTVYPELTKDMLRMRIIKGRRNNYHVSLKGQMVFVAESPDLSLEHVHVKR